MFGGEGESTGVGNDFMKRGVYWARPSTCSQELDLPASGGELT
jgi:hypothetical protein